VTSSSGARPKSVSSAPTLIIWGEKDIALGVDLIHGLERFVHAELLIERMRNTSHRVNEERPELVNRLLIDFLSASIPPV